MPLAEAIAEFIIQPIAEAVLQIAGYFTSRVVVPFLSFGHAYVEPAPKGIIVKPRWHGFHRDSDRKIVVDAEMGSLLGLIFWVAVIAAAVVIYPMQTI
jgi:hypothetical protein